MEPRLTASRFQTTSWTLIARAPTSRKDLGRLLGQYWSPVYAYIRRKGRTRDDAAELTQGFLLHALEKDLVGQADRARGRFRTFLLSALGNYLIDQHRRVGGRRGTRPGTKLVPDDHALLQAAEPRPADDPCRAFVRQWATNVLDRAIGLVQEQCRADGMTSQWAAFEARVLRPGKYDCEPEPMDALLTRLGLTQSQVVYSMIHTIKRKLDRALRAIVSETVEDDADVEDELSALREVLESE